MQRLHKLFLDRLRASGTTNMFGAERYLAAEFEITTHEAREIVLEWMQTFTAEAKP